MTRSGMFCAMATVIDRCKTEGIVDVFQVVKALRTSKPSAVPTVVSKLVLKVNVCCDTPHFHRRIMRLCTMPCSLFWPHTLIFRTWFEYYSYCTLICLFNLLLYSLKILGELDRRKCILYYPR